MSPCAETAVRRTAAALAAACALAAGPAARAQAPAPGPATLQVEVGGPAVGDGRRAVLVSVSGGPAADEAELGDYPMLPALTCDVAAVLAATYDDPPAVLAPTVRVPTTIRCTVTERGQEAPVTVEVRPAASGLLVETEPPQATAGDAQVKLRAFVAGRRAAAAGNLRAAASVGSVADSGGGELTLSLPEGKAPRAIAVALTDGTRVGAAFVPLVGRTMLPIETRPRTNVRVRIAGRWFGPVYARRRKIELPIAVPPGARIAVVRATDQRGNAKESLADLQVPSLPRIAAVAPTDDVRAGESTQIAVALASPRGGPGDAGAEIVAEAALGTLGQPHAQGGGVWTIPYRAPVRPGDERVEIRVASDAAAGSATVGLHVVPGPPAALRVTIPPRRYGPGEELSGRVVASDGHGNRVGGAAVEVSLGSARVTARPTERGAEFRLRVPVELPDDGRLALVAEAGGVRTSVDVQTRPDPPVSARVSADPDGRSARLWLDVRDAHGNLAAQSDFELRVVGATPSGVVRAKGRFRARLRARGSARVAEVSVLAQGRELVRARVRFSPPHGALVLGALAYGGWLDNGGDLSVPRGGVGVGLRKGLGPVEWAVVVGAEGYTFGDREWQSVAGGVREVSRSLRTLAFPLQLRGRLPIASRFGVAVGAAVVPIGVDASLSAEFQPRDDYRTWILGLRALAEVDVRVGPGRAVVAATAGTAKLSDGPLLGNIEGWGLLAGYEWWLLDLSR